MHKVGMLLSSPVSVTHLSRASAYVPSHSTPREAHACDCCNQDYQRTHHGQRAPQSRWLAWNVQRLCARIKEDPNAGGRSLVTNLIIAAFVAHCISAVDSKAIYTVCTGRRLRFSKSPLTETSNWTMYLAPWRSSQSSQTCRCRARRPGPATKGKMRLRTARMETGRAHRNGECKHQMEGCASHVHVVKVALGGFD